MIARVTAPVRKRQKVIQSASGQSQKAVTIAENEADSAPLVMKATNRAAAAVGERRCHTLDARPSA
jgi:hypothetical protein